MPNVGGPTASKRLLLTTVVRSKLLYAAPVWTTAAIKTAKNRGMLDRALRPTALRTIRAYRTVSTNGAFFLAGVPPDDLQASERSRIRRRLDEIDRVSSRGTIISQERDITIDTWLTRWSRSPKAQSTRRLLPNVCRWLNRPQQPMTFHLTQALSGHGCFREYSIVVLHRTGRAENAFCVF